MHNTLAIRLLNLALTALMLAVIFIAVFVFGPWIETKWFPVYSKFKITSIEAISSTQSRVVFQFTKLRQCEPQGMGWFFGEPSATFRELKVTIEHPAGTESAIRPIGQHITSPYVMDASVEQIASATFAEVYNRCHPFWLTRSEIYP